MVSEPVKRHKIADHDLFDDIRAGYSFVAERATQVRINDARLKEYALSLPPHAPDNTLDDTHHYMTQDAEHLAAAVLILDAVNFGSGYTEALVEEGWALLDNSIYFTVSTALKRRFETYGVFTARQLRDLTADDFIMLLDLPRFGPMAQQVARLYTPSVNELGAVVEDFYGGSFMRLIDAAEGSASRFVGRLGEMTGFHDVHVYQGRTIRILKRAQHVTASLNEFFARIGRPLFHDIDQLTIFADNAIPHVLRTDGVLVYTSELAARIDRGELISSGAEEEIEIRCCAAEAMERMAAVKGLKAVEMDYTLWHRSVEDQRYRDGRPHRTLTRFY